MLAYRILEKLTDGAQVCTSAKLAQDLGSTLAKIRKEITDLEKNMDRDVAEIRKKRGKGNGYSLIVYDEQKFRDFLEDLKKAEVDESRTMNHAHVRVEAIALQLLNSNGGVKSEDLAEALRISTRQLNNDLRKVRLLFSNYSLSISNRPYHGMSVEGSEFHKRLCLANLYMDNMILEGEQFGKSIYDSYENGNMIRRIQSIVLEESEKYHIQFSDIALLNLVIHLFVIVKRSSYEVESCKEIKEIRTEEIELTNAIINRISAEFSITLNEYDVQCLEIHIAGKRAYLNEDHVLISEEVRDLTGAILQTVDEAYQTSFQQDEGLALRLQLHLSPLLIRIRNHIVSRNPMVEEVKSKYVMAYEIAILAGKEIESRYQIRLASDELAYIALHFELSLYQTRLKKYKVLLICHTGACSSEILKQQIQGRFYHYISRLDTCAANQIYRLNLEEYTFIFTTIPVKVFTRTPVYEIGDFLDDKSIRFINRIFEQGDFSEEMIHKYFPKELFLGVISADSKEEAIRYMTEEMAKRRALPERFYEYVMERERVSPTDYGNNIAIPHPIHMSEDGLTYTCVAVLKKPILWADNIVKVVFLNNISKGGDNLQFYYYLLANFITCEDSVNALIKKPEYENLVQLLNGKS